MRSPFIACVLTMLCVGAVRPAQAQATVTFEVPLNLAQIPAGIAKVAVLCAVTSEAIVIPPSMASGWSNLSQSTLNNYNADLLYPPAARQEFWATGSLVITARVVVSLPPEWLKDPVGKAASYQCAVQGYNASTLKWDFFHEQAVAPWNLKLTPAMIQGEFVW